MPQRHLVAETIKEQVLADLERDGDFHSLGSGNARARESTVYPSDPGMIAAIKSDVLAAMEAEREAAESRREREGGYYPYRSSPSGAGSHSMGGGISRQLSADEREWLRQEILREIDGRLWEQSKGGPDPGSAAPDHAVVENVKNELLAEMQGVRPGGNTGARSWRGLLSDGSIDRRIDRQYGNLRDLRGQIRRGLETVRDTSRQLNTAMDPRALEVVDAVIKEARQEGVPLDEVIHWLKVNERGGSGFGQRMGGWFSSQGGKGFVWGVGASLVVAILFPATRQGLRNLGVKMMESTMTLADQTRSTFGRVNEDFEDMIAEANYNKMAEQDGVPTAEAPIPHEGPPEANP